ncbi:MAG TPA: malto-oligosyltrehalose synthase, partial [Chitinophagaceae bacterium]|nr:malto-oligosyltrehalose synthase [Chitinophagaceae bacterium]
MFDPVATYRLQFHSGFTFSHFQQQLPYLSQLGVRTIYASPIFEAVPGSTHGYDGLHPHRINPELGTIDQLRQVLRQVKERGMCWIQDIVPNHMAFHPKNEWLMDVLERGLRSMYASYFDINWNTNLHNGRLMVPFLGAPLKDVIINGELTIAYKNDHLVLQYYDAAYPLQLSSYKYLATDEGRIISSLLDQIDSINEIEDPHLFTERTNNWKQQFSQVLRKKEAAKDWLFQSLEKINKNVVLLQQIADEQLYRLCFWQETDKSINYRRFFTVNGLICLNMQQEHVFNSYHQLIKTLIDEGLLGGLRVDHIDGLYNPAEYLQRLRTLAGNNTYIVVEKILEKDEALPQNWPIQGATGYEFLAQVNNLLTQQKSEAFFTQFYNSLANKYETIHQQIRDKKAYILYEHMAGELENIYRLFIELELIEWERLQHISVDAIKKCIGEFLVHCPVYRYYGVSLPFDDKEATAVQSIIDRIKQTESELSEAVHLLEFVWLHKPHEGNSEYNNKAIHFYKRCMQFSGPLMAKGVEDTLMYTYNNFIGHNEVGDAPDAFGLNIEDFHLLMKTRQQQWPLSLNTTATHDTKRGEDVRARLNVLTDMPDQWLQSVESWQKMNTTLKRNGAPDATDEYFIYQTLIGTYPMPGDEAG